MDQCSPGIVWRQRTDLFPFYRYTILFRERQRRIIVKITGTPASNSDTNILDLSNDDDGTVTGTIEPFELIFNDEGADFAEDKSPEYTGKKRTKTVIKNKDKESEKTFTLVDWSVRGKLTDWPEKDKK